MFMRSPLASASFRNRNASGNVSSGAVTPPSTCISWKRCPLASASISIGGKTTARLSDAAHVPDHRTLRIEIGRYDKKTSAPGVFSGDCAKHVPADIAGNELAQMRISKEARSENSAHDVRRIEQAFSDTAGIDVSQRRVVGGAEKCKWGNQGAGAHPRNDRKFGTRARRSPAGQSTPAVCALGAP